MDGKESIGDELTLENLEVRFKALDKEVCSDPQKSKILFSEGAGAALGVDVELFARKVRGKEKVFVDRLLKLIEEYSSTAQYFLEEIASFLDPESYVYETEGKHKNLYDYLIDTTKRRGWSAFHLSSPYGNFRTEERIAEMRRMEDVNARHAILHGQRYHNYWVDMAASLPSQFQEKEAKEMVESGFAYTVLRYFSQGELRKERRRLFLPNIASLQERILETGQASAFLAFTEEPELILLYKKLGFDYRIIASQMTPTQAAYFKASLPDLFPNEDGASIARECLESRVFTTLIDQVAKGTITGVNLKEYLPRMQAEEARLEVELGERFSNYGFGIGGDSFLVALAENADKIPSMTLVEVFKEIVQKRVGHAVLVVTHLSQFRGLNNSQKVEAARKAILEGEGGCVLQHLEELPREVRAEAVMSQGGVRAVIEEAKRGKVLLDIEVAKGIIIGYKENKNNKDARYSLLFLATHAHLLDRLSEAEKSEIVKEMVGLGFVAEGLGMLGKELSPEEILAYAVQHEIWRGVALIEVPGNLKIPYAKEIAQEFGFSEAFVRRMLEERSSQHHMFFKRLTEANPHYENLYRKLAEKSPAGILDLKALRSVGRNRKIEQALREHGVNFDAWSGTHTVERFSVRGEIDGNSTEQCALCAREVISNAEAVSKLIQSILGQADHFTLAREVAYEDPKILEKLQEVGLQISKIEVRLEGAEIGEEERSRLKKALDNLIERREKFFEKLKESTLSGVLQKRHQELLTALGVCVMAGEKAKKVSDEWSKKHSIIFAGYGENQDLEDEAQKKWGDFMEEHSPKMLAANSYLAGAVEAVGRPLRGIEEVVQVKQIRERLEEFLNGDLSFEERMEYLKTKQEELRLIAQTKVPKVRTMQARMSARDLVHGTFAGNDQVCCLSVNNKVHDDGIPMLDLIADVGMQTLEVTDDARPNLPPYAGYMWIGKGKKSGRVTLVIDNIEGAPEYAAHYKDEIKEKMFAKAKDVARKCGIKNVVIGTIHNDVPIDDLEDDGETYDKLGGYVHEKMIGSQKRPRGVLHLEAVGRRVKKIR